MGQATGRCRRGRRAAGAQPSCLSSCLSSSSSSASWPSSSVPGAGSPAGRRGGGEVVAVAGGPAGDALQAWDHSHELCAVDLRLAGCVSLDIPHQAQVTLTEVTVVVLLLPLALWLLLPLLWVLPPCCSGLRPARHDGADPGGLSRGAGGSGAAAAKPGGGLWWLRLVSMRPPDAPALLPLSFFA